ncbi:MAG: class I SAM-dependent methyltransferase [Candidatus Bathyarchaeota archaeon]|nr:class I SAM-dependent methyltransferase [Candidatus Bathyarchaeota archaeon]
MKDSFFQNYSRKHVHFYGEAVSTLLELGLALVCRVIKKPSVVDLGCGDGRLIFALCEKGLLKNAGEIVGVDISESRIEHLTREIPFVKGIISDALNVKELSDSSFDFVICSQLVEHVKNDDGLLLEIKRLVKRRGLVYISSVIKKQYGVYPYFKNGSFRLDPTHVREYSSADEFVGLITSKGFEVIEVETRQVMFPLLDLVIRLFFKIGLLEPYVRFYQQHEMFSKIRRLRMPVVGYGIIEVLARKIE